MGPRDWPISRPRVHSIALELTGTCNQKCAYCYNAFRDDGGIALGAVDPAKLLARVDRILDVVELEHVTLTGGEPLAHPKLFEILDGLRTRSVRAQMISNASLVTDAIARRLAHHRLMSVLVTLNGPDAATHEGVIGSGGHFDRTVLGIRRLRAHRVVVQGSIVVTRRNARVVTETLQSFHDLGVRSVALSRFSPAGYATSNARELLPSHTDVIDALERAAAFARSSAMKLFCTMPIPPCVVDASRFPEIEFHHCPIGTPEQEFALGVHGEIRHCALHATPIADDVDAAELARVFAPGDPDAYRATLPDACRGCAHAHTCGGGCGAAAAWVAGTRSAIDPFVAWPRAEDIRRSLPVLL